jgi:hypothetical protein
MNTEAAKENRLTLLNLLNIEEGNAEKILGSSILITGSEELLGIKGYLKNILGRTFEKVDLQQVNGNVYSCEIVLGNSNNLTEGPFVYCGQTEDGKLITSYRHKGQSFSKDLHPFLFFIISCYASGLVVKTIIGKGIPVTTEDEIIIDINTLIKDPSIFSTEINLDDCYLAGAGAIGNSFLNALSTFKVKGNITIADPDSVSGGNLNRCLFFSDADINKKKVDALIEHAQKMFAHLKLIPFPHELGKVPAKEKNNAWLKKLIVGVDSRRARRALQSEIPKEVFDASTTGIAEVVIHHHKQPVNGLACLGCIYYKETNEQAHEKHVAEVLGVSVAQVNEQFIDKQSAITIATKYSLDLKQIIGIAYDTLFKQLCGEGKLRTAEDKQVLAPLAFVSGLAGALLALKVIETHIGNNSYNYWRVSPWSNPNFRLRMNYPINEKCEFCNNSTYLKVAKTLWSQ